MGILLLCLAATACGRKGPPLPPLVRIPAAPAELKAERQGASVDLQFVVPAANTDGSRPANIARVEIYALTSAVPVAGDLIVKHGTKVASVAVKAPRDPNRTIEADEPAADMEPPEGAGLDQGAIAHAAEALTAGARVPVAVAAPKPSRRAPAADDDGRPLVAPSMAQPARLYVGVAVTSRGKRGPVSATATVATAEPPRALAAPVGTFDERAVTLEWAAIAPPGSIQAPDAAGVLPSKPVGLEPPSVGYNVYEVTPATESAPAVITRLTPSPLTEPRFADPRVVFGLTRCYVVRALVIVDGSRVEGDGTPPACVPMADRFPPAAPKNLQTIPSDGAISLIWEANTEKDLRGYVVYRATEPAERLEPIMSVPIQETSFRDAVKSGVRFVYAVKAVDASGNESALSDRVVDTAR